MGKTKILGNPVIVNINNEDNKPLSGIPIWIGQRFISTDPNGEALFLGLEPGEYELSVDAADFHPLRKKIKLTTNTKSLGYILQSYATGSIAGNVRLAGTDCTLPNAEIKLTAVNPDEIGALGFSLWTDWEGAYSANYLPSGDYNFEVIADYCVPARGTLAIGNKVPLKMDFSLIPIAEPAKITVRIKTSDGSEVKESHVRLLEGMGAVAVAEKTGADLLVFSDIDRAPFNQVLRAKNPFINRNFVIEAQMDGYHNGYAVGDLRKGNECQVTVVCRKKIVGESKIMMTDVQSVEIPANEALQVQIPCERKERLLKIVLVHPGNICVKAGPNPYRTFLRILAKDLKVLAEAWNYAGQPVETTVQCGSGELLLGISGELKDVKEVISPLIVNYQPIINPYKPNDSFESALYVEFGEIIRPFIFPQNDINCFAVDVKKPGILRARLTGSSARTKVQIFSPQNKGLSSSWNYANEPIDTTGAVYSPGLYRIMITPDNSSEYTLKSSCLRIDFIGTESRPEDFNNLGSQVTPIHLGRRFGGTVFPSGKCNRYKFATDRTGFARVRCQLPGCRLRIVLKNSKGKEIWSGWNYANEPINGDIPIHEPGEYFIEVLGDDQREQHICNFLITTFFYPNDEYEGYKGNDSPQHAAEIFLGQEVYGAIEKPGDIDYYRFYVDNAGLIIQTTGIFPIRLSFSVTDPSRKEIFSSWNYAGCSLNSEYHVAGSGYYILKIQGTDEREFSSASYRFRLELLRIKPANASLKNKSVLNVNTGMILDALMPGFTKSFLVPVPAPQNISIGTKLPIRFKLVAIGSSGQEIFNSWNYAGAPLQGNFKLEVPSALQVTIKGADPGDWSKSSYFVYATDGDVPPEPVLALERVFEGNRKAMFNISAIPSKDRKIVKYQMDFEGSGSFKQVQPGLVEHIYTEGKLYAAWLRVIDDRGSVGIDSMFIDLVDVVLTVISCRVVFPQNGDVISVPQTIFAQASTGPGKPVKGMKLYLDERLIARNDQSHIEFVLDWKSLAPGEHTIKAEALSVDGEEYSDTVKFSTYDVFDLWPEDGKVITGSRAVFTWYSPSITATEIQYRKVGKEKWERAVGQNGKNHRLVLEVLDTGVAYEYKAGYEKAWSDIRSFTLQKGLAFERPRYGITIPREYGQAMPVTVRNNSDRPMEVVLECLPPDNPELLVGFVGEGSEDRPIHLQPGEVRQFMLSLAAQDCIIEMHRFLVRIRSDTGYSDQAEIEVRVKIPKVDLLWEELDTDVNTLSKKLRLLNKGDGLTDLTVRTIPANTFRLRPAVEHALLPANGTLELWVDPVLYEGFARAAGEVKVDTFGKTFSHLLKCELPQGMQVYRVTVDPTWWEQICAWFCTNRPVIKMYGRNPTHLYYGNQGHGYPLPTSYIETAKQNTPPYKLPAADVSFELSDAPRADNAGERVKLWLQKYLLQIIAAEKLYGVDRRAIAGAIAWEALVNVSLVSLRAVGPGKVHVYTNWWGGEDTFAKQVEDAGYIAKCNLTERKRLLATPEGAIQYIAAIMKAIAFEAHEVKYDIYNDPPILTTFYNSRDLHKTHEHFETNKPPHTLKPNDMGIWVMNNIKYLEDAVGKP